MTTGWAPLSTHVLDLTRGEPARNLPVRLDRRDGPQWSTVVSAPTDVDGRLRDWVPAPEWRDGYFRLVFDVAAYLGPAAFFPEVTVAFQVAEAARPHHVPLLLSPYGYATYRGS